MINQQQYQQSQAITIGYYPFRAKAQIGRLLCQYLHIPYNDLLLDPDQWELFKQNQAKEWIIKDMPFLVDGDFTVTGAAGLIYYIIEKAGRLDLFGKTVEDNVKITSLGNRKDIHNAILGLGVSLREANPNEEKKKMDHYWTTKIEPVILSYQKEAKENNWYLGYISLMDFVIYQLINQIELNFPMELKKFPKLYFIKVLVYNLPEICAYQNSARAVREFHPVSYFNRYKEQKMVLMQNSTSSSASSQNQMDIE